MTLKKLLLPIPVLAFSTFMGGAAAQAQLTIEPVINVVPDSDQASIIVGIDALFSGPGDKFAYVSGHPSDPDLDDKVRFRNDTAYDMTSLWLEIIGTGTDTKDPGTIVRGATTDAVFGDVNGNGIVSNVFQDINISNGGKTIQLTNGVLPRGAVFTDIHLATSSKTPDYAGIDSWYEGVQPVVPCDVASGVLGGFPRALCLFDTPVGNRGEAASIEVAATEFTVPENPGGRHDLDVFVLLANQIQSPPAMEYSTTFSWGQGVDPESLTVREWVGNFNFNPPKAIPLTHVNALDPSEENTPAEFAWVLNAEGLATGATVGAIDARGLAGIPPEAGFPFPAIDRYHFQIAGLPAGTTVAFTKSVAGGQVIPEPSSGTLIWTAMLGMLVYRRRR